jgi:hypothetical protein
MCRAPHPFTLNASGSPPSEQAARTWYMVSERDNAIAPDCERFITQRMRSSTASVDGSHAAFIAHPDIAAALILSAVASARTGASL